MRLQACDEPEVMLSGPAETGKTIASLYRVHNLALRWPGSQHVIIRKTYASAVNSVVQSYMRKVISDGDGIVVYGGERPGWFDYPNKSRVWVGGMDSPDKVLSSERDSIYVNQAEELSLTDWETLTTRATGRAGNMPFGQVFGDCNPGPSTHWIRNRPSLLLLESRHEDNPALFSDNGEITTQGKRTLAVLNRLTGVRKERLRFGRWVSAEGAVYEFDRNVHVIDRFDPPADWRRIRVIDFGFSNPFVCQLWAVDNDERAFLYREIYYTRRTVAQHIQQILEISGRDMFEVTIADHDAEDRATLESYGIETIPAIKSISTGIQLVQDRLKLAEDGRPRLMLLRDSLVELDEALADARKPVCTELEFDGYMWPKTADGRPVREVPVKVDDHGVDCVRYLAAYLDGAANTVVVGENVLGGYRG